jgi:gliding motility-associated-like protein
MENFDNKIRESLGQHELPLDAGAWASMEQALDKAMPVGASTGAGGGSTSWAWYATCGAFIVASGVALFSFLSVNENNIGDSMSAKQDYKVPVMRDDNHTSKNQKSTISEGAKATDGDFTSQKSNEIVSSGKGQVLAQESKNQQETIQANPEVKDNFSKEEDNDNVAPSHKGFLLGFSPSSRDICAGETVTFLNHTSEYNIVFYWDFGDGSSSSEHDPNHVFNTPGFYSVTLVGTRKGTDINESQTINILVKSSPKAEIFSSSNAKIDNLISYETPVAIGQTAEWNFSDGTFTSGNTAEHLYLNPGVQKVKLTVKNSNECIHRIDLSESISEELKFFVGNTFTPDGDGNNDEFFIPVLKELGVPFQLVIIDKNNQTVFTTIDANDSWNGKHLNTGEPLPNGKYSYLLTLNKTYLKNNTISGKVNLLRR